MAADTQTIVVALAGGVGGALLTGIFNSVIGVLADKRKKQHELDAWLRERRFKLVSELLDLINDASMQYEAEKRRALAGELHDRYVRVMLVAPLSQTNVLKASVDLITTELRGDFSTRSVQSIAWQSAYLQSWFTQTMGWNSEPLGTSHRFHPLRRLKKVAAHGGSRGRFVATTKDPEH